MAQAWTQGGITTGYVIVKNSIPDYFQTDYQGYIIPMTYTDMLRLPVKISQAMTQ